MPRNSILLFLVLFFPFSSGLAQEGDRILQAPLWFYSGGNTFKKSVLMVSNIRFCREKMSGDEPETGELAEFGIIPLPDNRISGKEPTIVYYEIYNLESDSLQNVQYRVQFVVQQSAVSPLRGKKKKEKDESKSPEIFLSLEHQIASKSSHQINYTQIDLEHLEEGSYEFMIIVSDMNASQNAVGQRHFELFP